MSQFFELRCRPSPTSHDRSLLTYAPDLDIARAQATPRLNRGAELIRHRWKQYPDARAANNAVVGGLVAQLPDTELMAYLEGEWEPTYRARNPRNDRKLQTRFDAEMEAALNHLRARQKLRALEDPNSPESKAVKLREEKQAELDRQKREQQHQNWLKARDARRNSEESKAAELENEIKDLATRLAAKRQKQKEDMASTEGVDRVLVGAGR